MDITKVQKKLQKLMALSTSSNEHEAQSAMRKVEQLMKEHNIREIDVNVEDNTADVTSGEVDGMTSRHRNWESRLASAIAFAFDGEVVIYKLPETWKLIFVAAKTENEIIINLYKKLRRIISIMANKYAKETEGNTVRLRNSYCNGMITTVSGRLNKIYKEVVSTTALVVVKKEAIDQKMFDMFGTIRKHKAKVTADKDAYQQGKRDGSTVGLNAEISC